MKPTKTRSVLIEENNESSGICIDDIIIVNGIHVDKTVIQESGSIFVCPTQEDRYKLNKNLPRK